MNPIHSKIFVDDLQIFTKTELHSRYHVLIERYGKDLLIEGTTLKSMLTTMIIPAGLAYRKELADAALSLKTIGCGNEVEVNLLTTLEGIVKGLTNDGKALDKILAKAADLEPEILGTTLNAELIPLMSSIREGSDALEELLPNKSWNLPKMSEILFT